MASIKYVWVSYAYKHVPIPVCLHVQRYQDKHRTLFNDKLYAVCLSVHTVIRLHIEMYFHATIFPGETLTLEKLLYVFLHGRFTPAKGKTAVHKHIQQTFSVEIP